MEVEPLTNISARVDAQQAQFTPYDYGRVGDQRPYQVVMPSYGAPQFLSTFARLDDALRECKTMCGYEGRPFRLMRWGARVPCYPCGKRRTAGLPRGQAIFSSGALEGYPEATPIAEARPEGVFIYGPKGEQFLAGQPNYIVSRKAFPPSNCIYSANANATGPDGTNVIAAPPQRYVEAVQSAQYLANHEGRRAYVCAGFGSSCEKRDASKWMPVVYAQPGGLVARYPYERDFGKGTVYGSTSITRNVTPEEFRELIAESEGASFLPFGS
jgi:hypothetical protein